MRRPPWSAPPGDAASGKRQATSTAIRVSGEAVGLFDRGDEVERRLLRQVVADAAGLVSGAGTCPRTSRRRRQARGAAHVRVALERDRRHGDRRECREPLLEHVELGSPAASPSRHR